MISESRRSLARYIADRTATGCDAGLDLLTERREVREFRLRTRFCRRHRMRDYYTRSITLTFAMLIEVVRRRSVGQSPDNASESVLECVYHGIDGGPPFTETTRATPKIRARDDSGADSTVSSRTRAVVCAQTYAHGPALHRTCRQQSECRRLSWTIVLLGTVRHIPKATKRATTRWMRERAGFVYLLISRAS